MSPAALAALAKAPPDDDRLADLNAAERRFAAWVTQAHAGQRPPAATVDGEPWRTWVFLGGRGAGKTRAGAEWLSSAVARTGRVALVGPTLHDVREVMVGGPSGLANLPGGPALKYQASRRRVEWANGCVAYAFSAEDPDSLRGPQFGAAWADEFCAWSHPAETLANLRLGLRVGPRPQVMVSTTPRPIAALRRLLAEPGTVRTHAPTALNAANLSPGFVADLTALYGGTRTAAQELEGVLLEGEGALFRAEDLARAGCGCGGAVPAEARTGGPLAPAPSTTPTARSPSPCGGGYERVVVAVDPPAGTGGSACGIVVAGRRGDVAFVLADRTAQGLSPQGWAERVAEAVRTHGANAVVAEANQGGDMVESVLRTAGVAAPVRLVHARASKRVRAEPVAALYEQGRVRHCGAFEALEAELLALGAADGAGEPTDCADALVWAVTDLLVERPRGPRLWIG